MMLRYGETLELYKIHLTEEVHWGTQREIPETGAISAELNLFNERKKCHQYPDLSII